MHVSTILFSIAIILATCLSVVDGESICCEGLPNCFTDDAPYDHLPLPQCQDDVQATFSLYTRRNPSEGVIVIPGLPLPYVFNGKKKTAFIIHGWRSAADKGWISDMKNGFLGKEDMNVIMVDWSEGAGTLWYPQAASNVRTTGAMVGKLSNQLIEEGGSSANLLWCLGASLGAHTCGQAGKYVTFNRVTGFDPAGPLFENYDISTGLSPAAGKYVEAIHSAGRGGLIGFNPGTLKPLGHVDFYPNGGAVQPGCDNYYQMKEGPEGGEVAPEPDMMTTQQTPYLACSHSRAYVYFVESLISNDCHFYANYKCTDSDNIPESCVRCGNKPCNEMGYYSDRAVNHQALKGLMYLETNSETPFCKR